MSKQVVKDTDAAKETKEFTVKVIPGTSFRQEGNKNGESMGTYKTSRTTTTAGGMVGRCVAST